MGRLALAAGLVVAIATVVVAAWLIGPWSRSSVPLFVNEATSSGLVHTFDGDSRFYVAGGLAAFDCDDDGKPELYLAGGSEPAALFHNESAIGGRLEFASLPDAATDLADVTGAYPLELDGDGIIDLVVLRAGENVLLRGLGACRFERANEAWGIDGGESRTTAFAATWEEGANFPTLAFGDFIALDELGAPVPPCPDNQLFRPDAGGQRYAPPIALSPGFCAQSMLFSDWDRSGRRDLRISNDRQYYPQDVGQEQLWRIEPGQPPSLYSDADGWVRMQIWGMGIASRDISGDGYPEVYLTSQGDNKLQTLDDGSSQPAYRNIALAAGVNAPQPVAGGEDLPSTAWHPEFADVNNDGLADLFVSKGNVSEQVGFATRDPSELLMGKEDGTFEQATEEAGIVDFARGRGAALVDLNLDGLLDLVEVNLGAPVEAWRNVGTGSAEEPGPMGHWLGIRLAQDAPNREGTGSWIEVRVGQRTLQRESTVGGGHISGQAGWIHFGLGAARDAEVRVTWPDGAVGPWQRVDADGFVIIERDAEAPEPWTPPDE